MPVHWTVSHPQRLVVAVAKDQVTVADIEQYFAGVTADGAMAYRKIFEITHTPMALSEENLKALGQRVMFYAQHGQIGPLAIVASSDESFAQAQIFAVGGAGPPAARDLPRAACRAAVAGHPADARQPCLGRIPFRSNACRASSRPQRCGVRSLLRRGHEHQCALMPRG